jgi:hypothetical protein
MSDIQSGIKDFGASEIMGPLLRQFVEQQLAEDLAHYKVFSKNLYFDWSESCGEGHSIDYLDGVLENFSYVSVFDSSNNLVAEGWLDFVDNFFDTTAKKKVIVYWDFVTTFCDDKKVIDKTQPGIPDHIWSRLDETSKIVYKTNRYKNIG